MTEPFISQGFIQQSYKAQSIPAHRQSTMRAPCVFVMVTAHVHYKENMTHDGELPVLPHHSGLTKYCHSLYGCTTVPHECICMQ